MRNDRYLLVADKDGGIIGRLRESDGISGCTISTKQNDNSTLSFEMLVKSDKYALLCLLYTSPSPRD